MPKSLGGLFGFVIASILTVAVGIFILTRLPAVWAWLTPSATV